MPKKTASVCNYPGCQQLAISTGYCQRHRNQGWQRDRGSKSMYDHRWERVSKAFLAANPWCHDCGCAATETHHVKKHLGNPVLFWDETNWMALCHRCHSKRTRRGE